MIVLVVFPSRSICIYTYESQEQHCYSVAEIAGHLV